MRCPICEGPSRVYNSRRAAVDELDEVRRNRRCDACGAQWQTRERFTHMLAIGGESTRPDRLRAGPALANAPGFRRLVVED